MNARDTADGFTGCIECDGPADDYDTDDYGRFQACSWVHADGCSEDPWSDYPEECGTCDGGPAFASEDDFRETMSRAESGDV